jgi:uncharacterized coiled-coil protein SlyX
LNKEEVLREISELIAMQESAIQRHPRKLGAVYENVRDVIKSGQHTIWESETGETLPLNDHEISQIQHYLTCSSFISAWYHLAGEKENRDKAAHSCATLISSLGPDPEEVMRKYIESEQLWRRAMKKEGVAPRKIGIFTIILIVLIIGAILMVIL